MADRYWVGGSLTWILAAGTNRWSATSGGPSGASVPTSVDNVFFDANSGSGTPTLGQTNLTCANLDFTGFTGTFGLVSFNLNVYGNLTLSSSPSFSITQTTTGGTMTMNATTSVTITSNGKSFPGSLLLSGTGTYTCQDILRVPGSLLLNQGTFTTTYDLYAGGISSGISGLVKAFNVTGANIYFTSSGTILSPNPTTLTWNADVDYYITDSTANQKTMVTAATYYTTKNIYFGGSGSGVLNLQIAAGAPTLIVTNTGGGSLNIINTTILTSLIFQSGTNAFMNQTTASRTMSIVKDLTFTSSQGASNISTTAFTLNFLASTTGTANITSAGKSLGNAIVSCNNASGTFNFLDAFVCNQITFTAGTYNVYGSFSCIGYVLTLTTGTLNCNSNTFNIYGFNSSSGTNVRTLNIGTGNAFWTIFGSFGWGATINGPMNIIGGSGFNNTIYFTDTTNTALLIGSNAQYPFDNVYFNRGASTGAINFFLNASAGSTFTNFIDNGTAAHTIQFSSSRTYTFGHFYVRGSVGNVVTLTSSGTSLIFNKSPSGLVNLDYVTVSLINASTTNTWYAGPNSTIVSGANWIISAPPARKLGGAGVG